MLCFCTCLFKDDKMFYKFKFTINLQAYRPVFKSSMKNEIKVRKIPIISQIFKQLFV